MKLKRNIERKLITIKSYVFDALSVLEVFYYNACCCKQEGNLPLV
ncbi:hypothetical protein [Anaerotignum propionicum]|uniref:Uncharacterized protein n=1 Tax=Anaerotignum propionicum DSM 1682 TaxID=991789 RepID=A0A0X1U6Q4_ANAPI|nr:hypothetical protein [Anaerotignum propionicum]AMJ40611.1 hypothetical protein CPRO_10160 [Anaerotignum propionicum DSM 1682]SHE91851.1 hypothetical protein SAMN02745151_02213 [[Clostridium] propionicum DSM 1682] [Anaerotignum propionicum DSM 1682]